MKGKLPTMLGDLFLGEAGRCPRGMVLRKGYTRADGARVGPACVPDVGKPGKTPPSGKVLPKPEAGRLRGWSKDLPADLRRGILREVAQADGCATAIRRLNLLANWTKTTSPETSSKARSDMRWLRAQGFCKLKGKA